MSCKAIVERKISHKMKALFETMTTEILPGVKPFINDTRAKLERMHY